MLCMPKIALWGGLMMGVESMEPNTPPLVMVKQPPVISSTLILPSRTLVARSLMPISTSAKLILLASRSTGTIKPFGPLTATEMSVVSNEIMSSPSIMLATAGNILSARTEAKVKKLINPRPTPCLAAKASLYSLRRSIIGFMSTSLKVVSIAVSFFTLTKRVASLRRSALMRVRVSPRPAALAELPIATLAFTASSLVMRPSFPVPATWLASMPFSARIFLAAGDAVPVAYVWAAGAAAAAATGIGFGALAAAGFAPPSGAAADVSMRHTTWPTATVVPGSTKISMTPAASAGSSSVALSESTSAIAWSFST